MYWSHGFMEFCKNNFQKEQMQRIQQYCSNVVDKSLLQIKLPKNLHRMHNFSFAVLKVYSNQVIIN